MHLVQEVSILSRFTPYQLRWCQLRLCSFQNDRYSKSRDIVEESFVWNTFKTF